MRAGKGSFVLTADIPHFCNVRVCFLKTGREDLDFSSTGNKGNEAMPSKF